MMGKITVKIFEAIQDGIYERKDVDCTKVLSSSSPLDNIGEPTEKMLRSVEGTKATISTNKKNSFMLHHKKGALLQEISITYCTALGLIKAGVLAKPPLWDFHRLKFGISKRDDPRDDANDTDNDDEPALTTRWKRVKTDAVYAEGILVAPAKEYDLIDLLGEEPVESTTQLISSDEDSDTSVSNDSSGPAIVSQDP